jgi:dihydrofolate reductase
MRKIIAYIAVSADGFIARSDGGIDWLHEPRFKGDYGIRAFFRSIDTILWGGTTYRESLDRGGVGPFGPTVRHVVFTTRPPGEPTPRVAFTSEPVRVVAARLRRTPGKDIWMMGGGKIIASFLDAGEIDEFVLHVIPTFIGEGIPLLAPGRRTARLRLQSCRRFPDGVVRLHYVCTKGTKANTKDTKSTKTNTRKTRNTKGPKRSGGRPAERTKRAA